MRFWWVVPWAHLVSFSAQLWFGFVRGPGLAPAWNLHRATYPYPLSTRIAPHRTTSYLRRTKRLRDHIIRVLRLPRCACDVPRAASLMGMHRGSLHRTLGNRVALSTILNRPSNKSQTMIHKAADCACMWTGTDKNSQITQK